MTYIRQYLFSLFLLLSFSTVQAAESRAGLASSIATNAVGIRSFDYVEFYVGSAKAVAYWHINGLGFELSGYAGPETGMEDRVSYYLTKNNLQVVVSSPVRPSDREVADFIVKHGDGVKRMAYAVDDVNFAYEYAIKHKAVGLRAPERFEDENGWIEEAAIKVYDDTEIILVNRDNYRGIFKPGYEKAPLKLVASTKETGLQQIDHIVGNVRINEMDMWANYLNDAFDFETFIDFGPGDIATEYSALLSKVVRSKDQVIKNPINESYVGRRKSQIEEYLEEYQGTGIQHIAITTPDIIATIDAMRANGVEFLDAPDTYYDNLRVRQDEIAEDISELQRLGILCDLEGEGYLLQIFTKPVGDRPTFFYEIIQRRKGAQGFGKGNFQALFESIEQEQARRGHL